MFFMNMISTLMNGQILYINDSTRTFVQFYILRLICNTKFTSEIIVVLNLPYSCFGQ